MGTSAVKVGRWTLSDSMASFGLEVCMGRALGSCKGEEGEGVFPARIEAEAIVEA